MNSPELPAQAAVPKPELIVSALRAAYIGDEAIPTMVAAVALVGADRDQDLRQGHLLFDGYPGTGKSMMAKALSRSIGGSATIVHCTPDMMPGDLTGQVYMNNGQLNFAPSDFVSANVVILDELSRLSPKTQAAALAAMQDGYIANTGIKKEVAGPVMYTQDPMIVLGTQNPSEIDAGTYPLNQANRDRFMGNIFLPRPNAMNILTAVNRNTVRMTPDDAHDTDVAVVTLAEFKQMQREASRVTLGNQGEKIANFAYELGRMSIGARAPFALPSGFRMPIDLARLSQSYAYVNGDTGVSSATIKTVAPTVATHRMDLGFNGGDSLEVDYATKVGYVEEALKKAGIN